LIYIDFILRGAGCIYDIHHFVGWDFGYNN
jgi:hypothetical protein